MCLNDKIICEYRDVKFFEHVFPLKEEIKSMYFPCLCSSMHDLEKTSVVSKTFEYETVNTSNVNIELEPRRSKRLRTERSFEPNFITTFFVERPGDINCNFTCLYLIDEDPKSYQEVLNSIDSNMWKEAIKSELDSLTMNQT